MQRQKRDKKKIIHSPPRNPALKGADEGGSVSTYNRPRSLDRLSRRLIIGVTGSFGSGKTTVARLFQSNQARIIDADRLAHQCTKRASPAYKKIIAIFKRGILKDNMAIDRKKLAKIVFNNRALAARLNNIIHPEVIRAIKDKIKKYRSGLIVLDAPLLIEAGLEKIIDKLVVVKLTRDKQVKRIQKRNSISRADILKRIKFQIPLRQKLRLADFIINNSGGLTKTKKQVAGIRRLLWKS
ncbi:MAG: dephospho-CoA kinase [Candidatus Omnitrophica bacterium]|nr:dephospho-CoA kinase [Candidatus Omnitrophota bacterium]